MSAESVMEEMERRLLEAQRAYFDRQDALMRSEGIAGVIRGAEGGLYIRGPEQNGAIVLFAMEDGTVRWKRP